MQNLHLSLQDNQFGGWHIATLGCSPASRKQQYLRVENIVWCQRICCHSRGSGAKNHRYYNGLSFPVLNGLWRFFFGGIVVKILHQVHRVLDACFS